MNYFSTVMHQLIINIMLDGKNMGKHLLIEEPNRSKCVHTMEHK
jgi:hypothetical protein